jgi:CheY-like chemotaxis protein
VAKIMLVEDDNSLREIYQARLMAEGYQTVTAKDGEEALALVAQEKPDLIILDVMMPKISGFDTLDILRSTPATQTTKVIMMSALSQAEDKTRAEKLGANKYLVKSQVTLEDIVKTVREVLGTDDIVSGANDLSVESPSNTVTSALTPVEEVPVTQDLTPPAVPIESAPEATEPLPSQSTAVEEAEIAVSQESEPVSEEQSVVNQQTTDFSSSIPTANDPAELSAPSPVPLPSPDTPLTPDEIEKPDTTAAVSGNEDSNVSSDPNPLTAPDTTAASAPPVEDNEPHTTVAISGNDTIAPPLSSMPTQPAEPVAAPVVTPVVDSNEPQQTGGTKIVTPLNAQPINPKSRLDELLEAEAAKDSPQATPPVPTPEATPPVLPTPPTPEATPPVLPTPPTPAA